MAQHFLLTSSAKTLTLASVARMSDEEAETVFRKIRWASNNGDPFCPKCGCTIVLAHKMREAMASEVKTSDKIGGEGKKAEIDGGYFGGYVKPANLRENRRDRRLRQYQSGKRQCVVVIRERDGVTLPGVYRSEGEALDFIRRNVYDCPAGEWNGSLAVQGVPAQLLDHQRNAVPFAQDAAPRLLVRYCDLLQ
jgi:hypothetical protein